MVETSCSREPALPGAVTASCHRPRVLPVSPSKAALGSCDRVASERTSMKRLLIAPVSLLLAVLTTPALAQTRQSSQRAYPMPKTLTQQFGTLPIWIDA